MTTTNTKLTGLTAIEYAEAVSGTLCKYADPVDGARAGLNPSEARDIAAQDASLIWCEVSAADISAIRDLARQDQSGEVDDGYARTGDAEDTIRRWYDAGRSAGDRDLIDLIDRIGVQGAARTYEAARR